jgi:hypothetical protein
MTPSKQPSETLLAALRAVCEVLATRGLVPSADTTEYILKSQRCPFAAPSGVGVVLQNA